MCGARCGGAGQSATLIRLSAAIRRRCDRLNAEVAAPIHDALDEVHPGIVLENWFTTLVPDFPTIGAVRRQRAAA